MRRLRDITAQEAGMESRQPYPLARERNLILASLVALSVAAWTVLLWQAAGMTGPAMGLTMGLSAPLFLLLWVVMMVAMMFPTAAPMILTFARVSSGRRAAGQPWVPTWLFTAAYLAIWTMFGVLAYLAARGADWLAGRSMWIMEHGSQVAAVLLILAGLYQLTPLKWACLSQCRSPLTFILTSWRTGRGGAVRMGLEHGLYCLGCCWLLFVLLLPLGMMNIAAMALLTLLIFAEKMLPAGQRVAQMAAAALILYGGLVLAYPRLLPMPMAM
jgi:predicted metal-binding membrane protein